MQPIIYEYLEEMQALSEDIAVDIFALECLRAYQLGQISTMKGFSDEVAACFHHRIQSELANHLYDLRQDIRFTKKKLETPLPSDLIQL